MEKKDMPSSSLAHSYQKKKDHLEFSFAANAHNTDKELPQMSKQIQE